MLVFCLGIFFLWEMSKRPTVANQSLDRQTDEMYKGYRKHFPEVKEVTVAEFLQLRGKKKFVLVDVRSAQEIRTSIIPEAISRESFEKDMEKYRNFSIIAYCTIGYRSGLFALEMRKLGLEIYNLRGGVLAWAQAGQLFSNSNGSTRRVHVYGKEWSLLPPAYSAVW